MTSSHAPRLAGLVAAALVAATGLVGLSTAPASAAYCATKGASAAVDFNDGAGGGIKTGCDPSGGGDKASSIFRAAGFTMQRNPDGSVCKVDGKPASAQCGRLGNEYWALYWSDGKSGWKYSQLGVDGLTIPEGGTVAWAWESGTGSSAPGVAPARPAAPKPTEPATKTPTPTPKPTKTPKPTRPPKTPKPTKAASAAVSAATTSTSASPVASASATATASASASTSPSASESAVPSETLEPTPDVTGTQKVDSAFTPEEEPSGLPAWVPITVIVALAGAAGGAVWWRRRTGAP